MTAVQSPVEVLAVSPATVAAEVSKPVLAERYKTKMCRNFVTTGHCPYETRCMFAHGPDELRTKEQNLRDGLTTEEAIRNFKRMQAFKVQYRQSQAALAATRPSVTPVPLPPAAPMVLPMAAVPAAVRVSPRTSPAAAPCQCAECTSRTPSPESSYMYNPYSWETAYTEVCTCPECMPPVPCACAECLAAASTQWDVPSPTAVPRKHMSEISMP